LQAWQASPLLRQSASTKQQADNGLASVELVCLTQEFDVLLHTIQALDEQDAANEGLQQVGSGRVIHPLLLLSHLAQGFVLMLKLQFASVVQQPGVAAHTLLLEQLVQG